LLNLQYQVFVFFRSVPGSTREFQPSIDIRMSPEYSITFSVHGNAGSYSVQNVDQR